MLVGATTVSIRNDFIPDLISLLLVKLIRTVWLLPRHSVSLQGVNTYSGHVEDLCRELLLGNVLLVLDAVVLLVRAQSRLRLVFDFSEKLERFYLA